MRVVTRSAEATRAGDRRPLGIVAGAGALPVLLARKHAGRRPIAVIGVVDGVDSELAAMADRYAALGPGMLGGILARLGAWDVREVALVGSVKKETVLDPGSFDDVGLAVLQSLGESSDRELLGAVLEAFVAHGFTVDDQRAHLPELVVPGGVWSGADLDDVASRDVETALGMARAAATAGIGQTVVVKQGVTVAVEAIEGTDEAIRRGALLAGEDVVVAKAAHPDHDFRCDVPTVGLDTLGVLRGARARALVLEAGRAFLLDRDPFLEEARQCGLAVLAR